ncbi:hypothetical protein [Nocardia nova]|uniref:hypothetical protein n=1 Tax=Nocardia nova TaxID=37330 RepID=UPI0011B0CAED|nr:hypothetical protein [Nocardia nova]
MKDDLSLEEYDALSRAEKFTYWRLLADEDEGMPSRPSMREPQAYFDEDKTPPVPGPGPYRTMYIPLGSPIPEWREGSATT